jgi:hypothetical protein
MVSHNLCWHRWFLSHGSEWSPSEPRCFLTLFTSALKIEICSSKSWYPPTRLHDVRDQKTAVRMITHTVTGNCTVCRSSLIYYLSVPHHNILYNDSQIGCHKTFLIVLSKKGTFLITNSMELSTTREIQSCLDTQ